MGGHHTKQTVGVSTNVAASIVQNTAQSCISVAYGGNTFNINGNYNDISGVAQTVSISVSPTCAVFASQNSTFDTSLSAAITQALSDQEVALTQWLDNSRDDQAASIAQNVTANFTQTAVQNCVNNLNGYNIFDVTGDGNVVRDVTQTATLSLVSQCILQGGQTSDVVTNITNTVNQQSAYTSSNPFSFITDALEALSKSILLFLAAMFVLIVCFALAYAFLTRHRRAGPAAAPRA